MKNNENTTHYIKQHESTLLTYSVHDMSAVCLDRTLTVNGIQPLTYISGVYRLCFKGFGSNTEHRFRAFQSRLRTA